MQHFTLEEINSWERFYRGNFINCLSGFKSASLLSTINKNGISNLAIFSNIVHLGAAPAMIGIVHRPLDAGHHTITNIQNNKIFTVNLITESMMQAAHQTSAKYADDVSEFTEVNLEPEWIAEINVPFVKESQVKYTCEFIRTIPIEENNTFFTIAKIIHVILNPTIIKEDGFLALEKVDTITSLGIDAYYTAQIKNRFSYAKNNKNSESIL